MRELGVEHEDTEHPFPGMEFLTSKPVIVKTVSEYCTSRSLVPNLSSYVCSCLYLALRTVVTHIHRGLFSK